MGKNSWAFRLIFDLKKSLFCHLNLQVSWKSKKSEFKLAFFCSHKKCHLKLPTIHKNSASWPRCSLVSVLTLCFGKFFFVLLLSLSHFFVIVIVKKQQQKALQYHYLNINVIKRCLICTHIKFTKGTIEKRKCFVYTLMYCWKDTILHN